jgi:hypothetical protein
MGEARMRSGAINGVRTLSPPALEVPERLREIKRVAANVMNSSTTPPALKTAVPGRKDGEDSQIGSRVLMFPLSRHSGLNAIRFFEYFFTNWRSPPSFGGSGYN